MISVRAADRCFLFLQGPPGPFFAQLGKELVRHGATVFRIHLNGGDCYDWPDGGLAYRGSRGHWPAFFDRFVSRNGVTAMGHELATQLGMTLFGRAANRHFLCYTGFERFDSEPEPQRAPVRVVAG